MPLLSGLPEPPCARCGRHARIEWGELCPICQNERMDRAIKLSRWVAIVAALGTGLYSILRIPPAQRYYGAFAVVAVYIIMRRIVTRLALEFLPREWETKGGH